MVHACIPVVIPGRERISRTRNPSSVQTALDSGFAAARRPGMTASEFHLRHLLDGLALVAEIEERLRRKAERGREQRRREVLDAGVEFAHRVVEEAPRGGELVLDIGE